MPVVVIYGTRITARTATRALILAQLVCLAIYVWLHFSFEDSLLPNNLLEIKEELERLNDSPFTAYGMGALVILHLASLAGLFFMAAWARWLFTATWAATMLSPILTWPSISINADVLQLPSSVADVLDGAILAVVWANAWLPSASGTAPDTTGVDSPR